MTKPLKTVLILCVVFGMRQITGADIYNVTLDTSPLVGHPAGPFEVLLAFTDGSGCLLYTSPSPRDGLLSRMPSSA